ncbi:WecB/TagA/CpsF family glycosyltransferase [Aliiglaciecola litoralis]|uniref:WecB/TagA/CpsF family glycosyltransferase n=1 Tax=Aliiglaciecola litoralis TaxID=582857 RepID=A0ABN1LIK1_9ALTE
MEQLSHRVRANIMGLAIDPIEFDAAVEKILFFAHSRPAKYVCVNSAQDVVIAQHDPRFRDIVNQADLATADGWPVVWSIRSRGMQQSGRVTGPDLMLATCEKSVAKGTRHFLYGGAEEVPALLTGKLEQRFPGITICGAHSPPFRKLTEAEDLAEIDMINQSKADVLWIGISTPKQHFWLQDHIHKLDVGVVITVGAAFDFHSGRVNRAPKWMRDHGLEWLHRAAKEPKRLGSRYAKYLPQFFYMSLAQRLGLKEYSILDCKTK